MIDREFLITSTPVIPGVTFLEASAGTGKTYTISKLVVRLIAEQNLTISNILVMTFTEAATRELKDRIRKAVQETLQGLTQADTSDLLAKQYQERPDELIEIAKRLRTALATFDEAAIFTIHGFCHRTLSEFAFEGNRLFEATLIKEPTPLWREAVHDYWRKSFYESDGFISSVLQHHGQTPETVLSDLLTTNRHPLIEVLPTTSNTEYKNTIEALRDTWADLKVCLEKERTVVQELLEQGAVFKKSLRDSIPEIQRTIQDHFPASPNPSWLNTIQALETSNLQSQLMQRHKDTPLTATFFEMCEIWNALVIQFLHQHLFHSIGQVRESFAHTKETENLLTFDDLLPAILSNLETENGSRLQGRIQGTYQAALIDEFQDTDPQQTEMFRRLFVSPEHFLFLIGDPKQAIYKFRGADIFSYLDARSLAKDTYTLSKNWRSDPKLIEAVNGLFFLSGMPFLFEEIAFLKSSAALEGGNFTIKDQLPKSPLKFCYLESKDAKAINNVSAKETIRTAVTQEILRLLGGSAQLKGKNVEPSDIAILSRSNREAHELRMVLSENGIPSVIYSDQTVFETEDASIFQILLHCLLEPNRIDWIRGLYVTSWFNWSAKTISEHDWTEIQEHFFALHRRWQEVGILKALDEWISWSEIKTALLSQVGGERNLTNLLHLVELVSKAELDMKLSPIPLLEWVSKSMTDPDKERDDFITRLESDDQAVQIVTIHKSKGLQYPIVFVPFAWNAPFSRSNEAWIYHKQNYERRLVYDNRSDPDDEDEIQYRKEELSDAVRLLYVALTRAENCCYLFWGHFKNQEYSSIGHLLGLGNLTTEPQYGSPDEALEALKSKSLPGLEILDTEALAEPSSSSFSRYEEVGKLKRNKLSRTIDRGFQISSFSSLATGFREAIDESVTEDEEGIKLTEDEESTPSIYSLPKGTIAGNLVHDVLELCDFTDPETLNSAIKTVGQSSLIKDPWLPILETHLAQLLKTPLPHPQGNIQLSKIEPQQCLKESEFHFPTRTTSTRELLNYFRSKAGEDFGSALPEIENWNEYRLNGFLRGFIDLLFEWKGKYYILDWKSNWLGNQAEDYDQEAMTHAIAHHAYFLQYYLYTLATVRYLQLRLPNFDYEKDFGGIFYLFVRGIDPNHPGSGVYFDRPELTAIQELDTLFQKN